MNEDEKLPVEAPCWDVVLDDSLRQMVDDPADHISQADNEVVFGIQAKDLRALRACIRQRDVVGALGILQSRTVRLPASMMGLQVNHVVSDLLGER